MSGTGGLEDRDSKAGPAPRRLLAPARPPRELRPHISLQPRGSETLLFVGMSSGLAFGKEVCSNLANTGLSNFLKPWFCLIIKNQLVFS